VLVSAYRLYHLDGSGRVDSAEWLEAADDSSAVTHATQVDMKSVSAELWLGNRRVARLDGDGATLDAAS
jgi:hypothetical protein